MKNILRMQNAWGMWSNPMVVGKFHLNFFGTKLTLCLFGCKLKPVTSQSECQRHSICFWRCDCCYSDQTTSRLHCMNFWPIYGQDKIISSNYLLVYFDYNFHIEWFFFCSIPIWMWNLFSCLWKTDENEWIVMFFRFFHIGFQHHSIKYKKVI